MIELLSNNLTGAGSSCGSSSRQPLDPDKETQPNQANSGVLSGYVLGMEGAASAWPLSQCSWVTLTPSQTVVLTSTPDVAAVIIIYPPSSLVIYFVRLTRDPSYLALKKCPHKTSHVGPKADSDEVEGLQRASVFLLGETAMVKTHGSSADASRKITARCNICLACSWLMRTEICKATSL